MGGRHDLAFSLGPNCKNAWNVRSHFGVTFAYPFDWWITPAKAMLAMLEPGFRFSVTADDLAITPIAEDGGNSVYNRRLHVLHHHDFPRVDNVVQELREADIAAMSAKYAARFDRLWADLAKAEAPLALLNGIQRGWPKDPTGTGRWNKALNGRIEPQDLITAIRDRLGAKTRVVITQIGPEAEEQYEGGVVISRPDTRQREPKGSAPNYAEPVHAFQACYAALDLQPLGNVQPKP